MEKPIPTNELLKNLHSEKVTDISRARKALKKRFPEVLKRNPDHFSLFLQKLKTKYKQMGIDPKTFLAFQLLNGSNESRCIYFDDSMNTIYDWVTEILFALKGPTNESNPKSEHDLIKNILKATDPEGYEIVKEYLFITQKIYGLDPKLALEVAREQVDLSESLGHSPGRYLAYHIIIGSTPALGLCIAFDTYDKKIAKFIEKRLTRWKKVLEKIEDQSC